MLRTAHGYVSTTDEAGSPCLVSCSDLCFSQQVFYVCPRSHRIGKTGRGHSGVIWSSLSAQAALVGGYAVVISWEGVAIDGYPGTALLRPVSATIARRRQKAGAQTDSLSQHFYKIYRAAGCSPKCRRHARKKIIPFSNLCTKQDGPLRPHFQSKVVQKTKGRNTMEYEMLRFCLPKLPCKQDVRILMLVLPQRNLHLMPPKARLGFC